MCRDDVDVEMVRACFAANGADRSARGLDWQYLRNPVGRLWAELAVDARGSRGGASLAALYASLAVKLRIGKSTRVGVQSLDTLTDGAFRGQGLFSTLARATFERAAADGVALVYGFPNSSSGPGFFGKLGWCCLDPVPFLIKPLRTRYLARRLSPALAAWLPDIPLLATGSESLARGERPVEVNHFDERYTRLWHSFSENVGVAVERDATYLNWRLVEKPDCEYQRLAILERDQPVAFVAFSLNEKHGGKVGTILELLHAPGNEHTARRLLSIAVGHLARDGADVLLAWCLSHSPNFRSYLRLGFMPFPGRLRPITLHFGVRSLDPGVSSVVNDRTRWYISYLDSDTI